MLCPKSSQIEFLLVAHFTRGTLLVALSNSEVPHCVFTSMSELHRQSIFTIHKLMVRKRPDTFSFFTLGSQHI